jgi:alkylation response protein AidB-like acyl-CoA dehydrogenase
MNFGFNERENSILENARNIAQHFSHQSAYAKSTGYLRKIWHKYGECGMFALNVPAAFNGAGLNAFETALSLNGFASVCPDNGFTFSLAAHTFAGLVPLVNHGTPELQKRILPKVSLGKFILANAMTETSSGSNAFALKTTATRSGNNYILNGTKTFCTNGAVADGILVYALTDASKGFFGGISCFLLERGQHAFKSGLEIEKIGLRSSSLTEIFLQDVVVSEENLIGKQGGGALIFLESMNWERAGMAAMHAGMMQRLVAKTRNYINQKESGGKKISAHQGAQFRLAEMATVTEASLMLGMNAAKTVAEGKDATAICAQAKIYSSEALHQVAREALILHGGNGITESYEIAQALADAQAASIYSGPNDVLRELLASRL